MKINERILVQVVNSSVTPVDRSGWLWKRGETNRSFQKRWCVLKANLLYYFDKKSDREPIGVIMLEGCRVELDEHETEYFSFKIEFGDASSRTYVLGCDGQQDMEGWMKALSCASYHYIKMLVSELQRQLDSLTETKRHSTHRDVYESVRQNPFDNECLDLVDLKAGETVGSQSTSFSFTQRAFAEIHEFYGLKFRFYSETQRDKHQLDLL